MLERGVIFTFQLMVIQFFFSFYLAPFFISFLSRIDRFGCFKYEHFGTYWNMALS